MEKIFKNILIKDGKNAVTTKATRKDDEKEPQQGTSGEPARFAEPAVVLKMLTRPTVPSRQPSTEDLSRPDSDAEWESQSVSSDASEGRRAAKRRGRPIKTGEYVQLAAAKRKLVEAQQLEFDLEREKKIYGSEEPPAPFSGSLALPSVEALGRERRRMPAQERAADALEWIRMVEKVAAASRNLKGTSVRQLRTASRHLEATVMEFAMAAPPASGSERDEDGDRYQVEVLERNLPMLHDSYSRQRQEVQRLRNLLGKKEEELEEMKKKKRTEPATDGGGGQASAEGGSGGMMEVEATSPPRAVTPTREECPPLLATPKRSEVATRTVPRSPEWDIPPPPLTLGKNSREMIIESIISRRVEDKIQALEEKWAEKWRRDAPPPPAAAPSAVAMAAAQEQPPPASTQPTEEWAKVVGRREKRAASKKKKEDVAPTARPQPEVSRPQQRRRKEDDRQPEKRKNEGP